VSKFWLPYPFLEIAMEFGLFQAKKPRYYAVTFVTDNTSKLSIYLFK